MAIDPLSTKREQKPSAPVWMQVVAKYEQPRLGRALCQLINTIVPYVALWYLMYLCLEVSYWLTGMLAVLASGFPSASVYYFP